MTTLSIVIPTAGRPSLENTLRSYAHQLGTDDEVLVMGDCTDGALYLTEDIVQRFRDGGRDDRFKYHPVTAGYHSWGHNEINMGLTLATGQWLLGNDDDDVATPKALADIRAAIAEQPHPRPLLFQFMAPWRQVLWETPELREAWIGGHCLVQPNVLGKVANMTPRYNGDFDWIAAAIELYGGDFGWVPKLIAWTRPTAEELARLIPEGVAV